MESRKVVSTLIMVLVILVGCDNAMASDDTSRHYVAVKNQQNGRMCSNAIVPDKTIKMVRSPILCSGECSSEEQCVGFNFRKNKQLCELFKHPKPTKFDVEEDCSHFQLVSGVEVSGTVLKRESKNNCSIPFTYDGQIYLQCVNFSMFNHTDDEWTCLTGSRDVVACDSNMTGYVTKYEWLNISIPTFKLQTPVMSINCWIFIHQKLDDYTYFNLYWSDYKAGFGIPGKDFWFGLERMHQMTSTTPYRLRVEVQASYNNLTLWYSAEYDTFLIDNEAGGYAIHVSGYHGDAGDAICRQNTGYAIDQNGMKFSTRDVDNDRHPSSCAINWGGGNWYNGCSCFLLTSTEGSNGWCSLPGYGEVLASRMMIKNY